MAAPQQTYVLGLRWESRSIIAYIALSFVMIGWMAFVDHDTARFALIVLMLLGSWLAFELKNVLRDDYLHVSSGMTGVSLLPGVSLATVYVGMLGSWMRRVGFGPTMRVAVPSFMLWSVTTAGLHLGLVPSVLVFGVSVSTSVLREVSGPSRFLIPWLLVSLVTFSIALLPI